MINSEYNPPDNTYEEKIKREAYDMGLINGFVIGVIWGLIALIITHL